jgi:hypothetical protein
MICNTAAGVGWAGVGVAVTFAAPGALAGTGDVAAAGVAGVVSARTQTAATQHNKTETSQLLALEKLFAIMGVIVPPT